MPRVTLQNLGAILQERRGAIGIRAAAKEIGTSSATLSRVENGHLPDLTTFGKICKYIRVDPSEILGFDSAEREMKDKPQSVATARFKAEREIKPATANALANVIMATQRMLQNQSD